jgi:hypothetical protein
VVDREARPRDEVGQHEVPAVAEVAADVGEEGALVGHVVGDLEPEHELVRPRELVPCAVAVQDRCGPRARGASPFRPDPACRAAMVYWRAGVGRGRRGREQPQPKSRTLWVGGEVEAEEGLPHPLLGLGSRAQVICFARRT